MDYNIKLQFVTNLIFRKTSKLVKGVRFLTFPTVIYYKKLFPVDRVMCIYVYITIFLHKRKDVCVLWVTVTSHHLLLLLITESLKRDGSDGKNGDKVTVTQRCLETSQTSIQR